ncbi:MAG: O-antigen ligase family protein [Smithella sp.]|nr:O-antigen ligase family protein [Smithella sp.]
MLFDTPVILLTIICFFLPSWLLIITSVVGVLLADTRLVSGQYLYYARFVPPGVLFLKTIFLRGKISQFVDEPFLDPWKKWIPFIIFIFISAFYADDPVTSIQRSISAVFVLIGFPMAVEYYLQDEDSQHKFMIILSVIFIFINIYAFYSIRNYASDAYIDGRIKVFFRNPNSAGLTAMISTLLFLYGTRMAATPVSRNIFFLNVLISGLMVFLSGSRASVLGLLMGLMTFYLMNLRLGHKKIRLMLAIMIVSFVMLTVVTLLFPQATERLFENDSSGRLIAWALGWNMFQDTPFFGVGFGSSDLKMQIAGAQNPELYFYGVHNSYLRLLIECGVIGLFLSAIPILYTMIKAWRSIVSVQNMQLNAVMMSLVVAGLVNAVFEDWLFGFGSSSTVPFWLFFSILSVQSIRATDYNDMDAGNVAEEKYVE